MLCAPPLVCHQTSVGCDVLTCVCKPAGLAMLLSKSESMPKSQSRKPDTRKDPILQAKLRKKIPYEFVLEALADLSPWTRPMFGCLAVYVEEKIVLILREKSGTSPDNGVWLATTREHHESLRRDFPNMRSIEVLGKDVTGWQVLPADADDFEQSAARACELVLARDPRIGKVPKSRRTPKVRPRSR